MRRADHDWPPVRDLRGFVLRSVDVAGRTLLDVERICGFQFGYLSKGCALYRMNDRILHPFLVDPIANVEALGIGIVGFNNERGPRDWDAMEIAAYYGDVSYNGYSQEIIRRNADFYSPSAKPLTIADEGQIHLLAAELTSLYQQGGFLAKVLPHPDARASKVPHEAYPAGSGIREYQFRTYQSFRLVGSYGPDAMRKGVRMTC